MPTSWSRRRGRPRKARFPALEWCSKRSIWCDGYDGASSPVSRKCQRSRRPARRPLPERPWKYRSGRRPGPPTRWQTGRQVSIERVRFIRFDLLVTVRPLCRAAVSVRDHCYWRAKLARRKSRKTRDTFLLPAMQRTTNPLVSYPLCVGPHLPRHSGATLDRSVRDLAAVRLLTFARAVHGPIRL